MLCDNMFSWFTKFINSKMQKIVLIICFVLLSISLIVTYNHPSSGYEYSIYSFTPKILWISIIFSILCGFFIVLNNNFTSDTTTHFEIVGLFLISLCFIICNAVFIIRGYYLWCIRGDPATHIGFVNEILLTGHLPLELFYPALHIYTSQIFSVSGVEINTLSKILPLIFSVLYIPFMYVLSKAVFPEKSQIILSIVAGCTLINGWYLNFTPNCLSNLYFPLLIYILFKKALTKDTRWELFILIMVFFYPIFHIIPTLTFIIFISTLFIPNLFFSRIHGQKQTINQNKPLRIFKLTLLILVLTWSITWISSFYVWDLTIKNFYILMTESSSYKISALVDNVNYAKEYGYDVVGLTLKNIGGPLIYVLISIISFPTIWSNKEKLNNLFSLYGPLLCICLITVAFFFTNILFDPLRMVTYATIISTLFVGFFLDYLIRKIKCRNNKFFSFGFMGIIILLLIIWINGIFTLYPSPYKLESNFQTTKSDVEGMSWLFENRNLDIEVTGMTVIPFRYADLLLSSEDKQLQKFSHYSPSYLKVPYHFGYDSNPHLSSYFYNNVYLVANELDKSLYKDLFPQMAEIRWIPSDFEKLNKDSSIMKIYSSKKVDIFYIEV